MGCRRHRLKLAKKARVPCKSAITQAGAEVRSRGNEPIISPVSTTNGDWWEQECIFEWTTNSGEAMAHVSMSQIAMRMREIWSVPVVVQRTQAAFPRIQISHIGRSRNALNIWCANVSLSHRGASTGVKITTLSTGWNVADVGSGLTLICNGTNNSSQGVWLLRENSAILLNSLWNNLTEDGSYLSWIYPSGKLRKKGCQPRMLLCYWIYHWASLKTQKNKSHTDWLLAY